MPAWRRAKYAKATANKRMFADMNKLMNRTHAAITDKIFDNDMPGHINGISNHDIITKNTIMSDV